jgi:hypothetical protein
MQGMMIEYAGNSDHFTGEPGFTIHMGNQGLPGSSFHTAEDPGYSVIPSLTLEYPGWPHLQVVMGQEPGLLPSGYHTGGSPADLNSLCPERYLFSIRRISLDGTMIPQSDSSSNERWLHQDYFYMEFRELLPGIMV